MSIDRTTIFVSDYFANLAPSAALFSSQEIDDRRSNAARHGLPAGLVTKDGSVRRVGDDQQLDQRAGHHGRTAEDRLVSPEAESVRVAAAALNLLTTCLPRATKDEQRDATLAAL